MPNIKLVSSTVNTTRLNRTRIPKYIVIHYTAGVTSKKGSARNTAGWFMSGKAGGSADFIVDDEEIIQYNADIEHRYCWGVGGSKYAKAYTTLSARYYGKCLNNNSISIEICSNKINTKSLGAEESDWFFTEKAIANAVELTRFLMEQYKIPAQYVIMHHEVTGKICPNPWCLNEGKLSGWRDFQRRISSENPKKEEAQKEMTIDEFIDKITPEQTVKLLSKLTDEQVSSLIDRGRKHLATIEEPMYSRLEGYWKKLEDTGTIANGRPMDYIRRVDVVTILGRLGLIK